MAKKQPQRKKRFGGRVWGAMWRGYVLPGYFVFRTRKEAWNAILAKIHHRGKKEAMSDGWRVCRLKAEFTLLDALPNEAQIAKWERREQRIVSAVF